MASRRGTLAHADALLGQRHTVHLAGPTAAVKDRQRWAAAARPQRSSPVGPGAATGRWSERSPLCRVGPSTWRSRAGIHVGQLLHR